MIINAFEEPAPFCPSEDCPVCIGEACLKCGAGLWRKPWEDGILCDHDVCERHEEPDAITECGRLGDTSEDLY